MKPLFIPLKKEWYLRFKDGSKTIEYRAYGPRWNEKTCYQGREAVLSNGYTNKNSLHAVIDQFEVISITDAPMAAREIYPKATHIAAIAMRDIQM